MAGSLIGRRTPGPMTGLQSPPSSAARGGPITSGIIHEMNVARPSVLSRLMSARRIAEQLAITFRARRRPRRLERDLMCERR